VRADVAGCGLVVLREYILYKKNGFSTQREPIVGVDVSGLPGFGGGACNYICTCMCMCVCLSLRVCVIHAATDTHM
jgi:hypothetical protein